MSATVTAEAPHVDPERGLTAAEVAERVARGQINDVPAAPTRTVAQIVRGNVFTRFNAILGAMLAIILVVGPLQDALFGLVLIANAGIGIVQELRAKRTLDRLTVLTAPKARVVRDGEVREVAVGEVVLDDVLDIGAGSEIVVDGEVLTSRGARGRRVAADRRVRRGRQGAGRRGAERLVRGRGRRALPRHPGRRRGLRGATRRGRPAVLAHALGAALGHRPHPHAT